MKTSKIFHDGSPNLIPANREAARLFSKAPWWAHAPEPAKKSVAEVVSNPKISVRDLVNVVKAPPAQMKDRRGEIFEWDGHTCIILGYSHTDRTKRVRKKRSKKPPWWKGDGWNARGGGTKIIPRHCWWATYKGDVCLFFKKSGSKGTGRCPWEMIYDNPNF